MRYQVLRGFCLGAGRDVFPGDTIELDDKTAPYHLARGRVKPAPPEVSADTAATGEEPAAPKKRSR